MATLKKQTDCTPRYLLTHKEMIEKMGVYLELISKASKRLNNKREIRNSIFYRRFVDEPKIEMAEAALNRLNSRYRDLVWEFHHFNSMHFLRHTDKKYIQF